jgi:L-fuconolactonase
VTRRILDSHLHLWDPEVLTYGWLSGDLARRHGPDELDAALAEAPAAPERGFVFVQADPIPEQALAEVEWVAGLVDRVPLLGIVAHAPLEAGSDVMPALDALEQQPLVVGVRRLLQSERRGFALEPGFLDGARALADRSLVFDACVRAPQLPDVVALADAVPGLTIVLDHLGKPPVGADVDAGWRATMHDLAARPNVTAKVSGLPAEAGDGWRDEDVLPYLDVAAEAFGLDRLMFGGDWPVSQPYGRWQATVGGWLSSVADDAAADAVLWRTAERVYRLAA